MDTFKKARDSMILSQLQTNEVTNTSLLEAMKNIPREIFVPENLADIFYSTRAKTQYRTKDKVKLYKESLDFIEEVSRREREVTGMKLARKEYEGEGRWSLI